VFIYILKAAELLRNVLSHTEPMDYRCEDKLIIDELIYRRCWSHLIIGLGTLLFQKTPIINPKNESHNQEMHLTMPILSQGLKLAISKIG
jgi:hypothetical protein